VFPMIHFFFHFFLPLFLSLDILLYLLFFIGYWIFIKYTNIATTNVTKSGKSLISTIAIEKTLRKGGEVFLKTVIDEKTDYCDEVLKEIANVLQQFEDVMLP